MDQFEETSNKIKDKIATKITNVDSLVYNLLTKIEHAMSDHSANHGQFSSWVSLKDKQLLQLEAEQIFDVVVAAGRTENFTKVMDVVNAAPDSSVKRYVIFIKRGVYKKKC